MDTFLLALPPASEPKPEAPSFGIGNMLPFLLVLVVLMLFMPLLSKKERTRQKRLQGLKKYDRVVTSGGMYGTVISFDDQTATLEVAKGLRIVFKRSSVYDIEKEGEAPAQETPEKPAGAKG
ncbi:MAG TPA: preprotein translocase subunit YajC [Candidatus Eisenbacteria bacterium]|nr:preprotein translocase subunit YajC [Candidatus Eisenbacteria bacterium]